MTLGSKGIRQYPINWCRSSMIKHKITPSLYFIHDWNILTLDIMSQLIKTNNSPRGSRRKCYYKTLGTVPSLPAKDPSLSIKHHLSKLIECYLFWYLSRINGERKKEKKMKLLLGPGKVYNYFSMSSDIYQVKMSG